MAAESDARESDGSDLINKITKYTNIHKITYLVGPEEAEELVPDQLLLGALRRARCVVCAHAVVGYGWVVSWRGGGRLVAGGWRLMVGWHGGVRITATAACCDSVNC